MVTATLNVDTHGGGVYEVTRDGDDLDAVLTEVVAEVKAMIAEDE